MSNAANMQSPMSAASGSGPLRVNASLIAAAISLGDSGASSATNGAGDCAWQVGQHVRCPGLARKAAQQAFDHGPERHVRIPVMADADGPVVRQDRRARGDRVFRHAEVRVARRDAEQQQAIGFLDQVRDGRIAGGAEVRAHQG